MRSESFHVMARRIGSRLEVTCRGDAIHLPGHALFVAIQDGTEAGSPVLPFGRNQEGSTVFLPFRASRLYRAIQSSTGTVITERRWDRTRWLEPSKPSETCTFSTAENGLQASFPLGKSSAATFSIYIKLLPDNNGWGRMLQNRAQGIMAGTSDVMVARCYSLPEGQDREATPLPSPERLRIYQLLPRLFSNTNETRKPNGTAAENGVGKFEEISSVALSSIRSMGFTHLWLTGVLQQATSAAYPEIEEPADDPDLLKGLAGSPYAIKDYFDVCPDYAVDPRHRLEEFRRLLDRAHACGLKTLIDFVPNHVARSYRSDIRPNETFGREDDRSKFFTADNHFFYLGPTHPGGGPPLSLPTVVDGANVSPTCAVLGTCDGRYIGEMDHGRVTGNNGATWAPSINDWYETVKLNYGYDFTIGVKEYPHGPFPEKSVPSLWPKMDSILSYWQEMGVDGFRCDMAHMVPPEFWTWAIAKARGRNSAVTFIAEAYDNDPAKVCSSDPILNTMNSGRGDVMLDLLCAGFDAVYDDPAYKALKAVYDSGGWANDLDRTFPHPFVSHRSLRYAENHDEVRLAAARHWGNVGPEIGIPVCAILYGLGRGPLLLYHGQEVGEPAAGEEGFSGNDGRTTIFDYWSMPELARWVNGHRYDGGLLSQEQAALRASYARLIALCACPVFQEGECFPLNPTNLWNEAYGRLPGETASGHWLYSFIRTTGERGEHFLVVVNLHPSEAFSEVRIILSPEAHAYLALKGSVTLTDRLATTPSRLTIDAALFLTPGISIHTIPPLTAYSFEITSATSET